MAKVNLLGVRDLDFKNNDGDTIKGLKIFFCYPDPNVSGQIADSKFISSSLCHDLGVSFDVLASYVGQPIDLEVNFKGKICGISAVEG